MSFRVVSIVGTDQHPFDRLVEWVDSWAQAHPQFSVFQQIGTSRPPVHCEYTSLVPLDVLLERISEASVVVTHAGPATIADIRQTGRLPIVVPRDPEMGEHVDSHQKRYAAHLGATGRIRVVLEQIELVNHLDMAMSDPASFRCEAESPKAEMVALHFGSLVYGIRPRRGR